MERFVIRILVVYLFTLNGGILAEDSSKISPQVLEIMQSGESQNVMVECGNSDVSTQREKILNEISNLVATSPQDTRKSGDTRITDLVNIIESAFTLLMASLLALLNTLGVKYEILWVADIIFIRNAWPQLILDVAGIAVVIRIRKEQIIPGPTPPSPQKPRPPPTGNLTWNIGLIDARCPGIKCLGKGVLVGIMDTGALWDHDDLKENWIGERSGWMDGMMDPTSAFPFDINGHGTHVTGTIVGKYVGVAPEANWTACRVGDGFIEESAALKCAQFFSCPYLWNDTSANKTTKNCSARPHIINNSWGGAGGSQTLDPSDDPEYLMIKLWNALGIIPIFSNGNNGPSCGSGGRPANFDHVMAVGAVNSDITIAGFSSRGPTTMTKTPNENTTADYKFFVPPPAANCVGPNIQNKVVYLLTKPDIVAPGVGILSSWNTGKTDYILLDGTSMACPHVAGVVALMMCANRKIKWDYKISYKILTETVDTTRIDLKGVKTGGHLEDQQYVKSSNILCNFLAADICSKPFPNNVFGYGLINACDAVKKIS